MYRLIQEDNIVSMRDKLDERIEEYCRDNGIYGLNKTSKSFIVDHIEDKICDIIFSSLSEDKVLRIVRENEDYDE